jgi:histidinol-phosphate/aromatic aminotransferase/cobyric acid decarboxylase-like protein
MFGMPDGVRITVGTPQENAVAVEAIRTVLPALVGS